MNTSSNILHTTDLMIMKLNSLNEKCKQFHCDYVKNYNFGVEFNNNRMILVNKIREVSNIFFMFRSLAIFFQMTNQFIC